MIVEPYISPVLLDKAVQNLKDSFLADFAWLEQCYGIAQVGIVDRETGEYKFPVVYYNDGDTFQKELHPDQDLQSFGFFELNAPYSLNFELGTYTYNLNFVCWLNLPLIDDSRTDDFTGVLVRDVIGKLRPNSSSIAVEIRHENIFNRYDYDQSERQFLLYPYSGFKITFEYNDIC